MLPVCGVSLWKTMKKRIISLAGKDKGDNGKLWSPFQNKVNNNFEVFISATMNVSMTISADSQDLAIKERKFLCHFHAQSFFFFLFLKRKLIQV